MSESSSAHSPIELPAGAHAAVRAGVCWFDNDSSRRSAAALAIVDGRICAVNEHGERREAAVCDMEISSRLGNAPRRLVFPDGAAVVVDDNDAVDALLRQAGGKPPFLHRIESAWKNILLATFLAATSVYAALTFGVPAMADVAAHRVPQKYLTQLSDDVYQELTEQNILKDSTLSPAKQERIRRLFAEVSAPWKNEEYNYRVRTHQFALGAMSLPNAFALPDGTIVVTDALAKLLSDDEIRAVLAHEIGHVQLRHSMRALLSATGTGLFLAMLGDVSFLLSGGAILLELKYSRAHETEADCFAYHYLRARGLNDNLLGAGLQKMESSIKFSMEKDVATHPAEKSENDADAKIEENSEEFWQTLFQSLSTHPATEARLDLAKACAAA